MLAPAQILLIAWFALIGALFGLTVIGALVGVTICLIATLTS